MKHIKTKDPCKSVSCMIVNMSKSAVKLTITEYSVGLLCLTLSNYIFR